MGPGMLFIPKARVLHQNNMLFIVKHIYSSKEGGFSKNPSDHQIHIWQEYRMTHLLQSVFSQTWSSRIIPVMINGFTIARTPWPAARSYGFTIVSLMCSLYVQWFHYNDSATHVLLWEAASLLWNRQDSRYGFTLMTQLLPVLQEMVSLFWSYQEHLLFTDAL